MHRLLKEVQNRIVAGLKRKNISSCSQWAESYRVMGPPFPGPWTFDYHPWTREMHDDDSEIIVGQKGAQLGFTETALNKTFYAIDILGISVLYVLPAATPDASDFSTARFDPALEMSKHLHELFSDVKNIGHKRAGNANLYIRGSRSRSQLKSIPVGLTILDEVDEMVQDNIPLAMERMAGQIHKQTMMVSTPTIDNYGINYYYRQSTQDHYYFICPHCSRWTEFEYPKCIVITADSITDPRIAETYIKCKECDHEITQQEKREILKKGKWIPTYSDRAIRGFNVSQLYSTTIRAADIALSVLKAQTNPADEQELYNSKLGLTHAVEGARVTDSDIEACQKGHRKGPSIANRLVTMGIDVGKWLHYEIDEWVFDLSRNTYDVNLLADGKLIQEGKVVDFEELDTLMKTYHVLFAVIDANPERRKSLEFAQRFHGRVRCAFYGNGISGKAIHLHDEMEHTLTVDRTSWMDLSLGRIRRHKLDLPIDLSIEWKVHIKAPVRIYEKDASGNPVGKYVTGNEEDHFAHARTYSEIALRLAASLAKSENITGVM